MADLPKVEVRQQAHDSISSLLELDHSTTDSTRHYRWVSTSPRSLGNAKIRGYEFVSRSQGVKTRAGYLDDAGDDYLHIQDVVLMSCDLAQWERRKKKDSKVANSRLSAPKKQFKTRAKARRVRILNEEDE